MRNPISARNRKLAVEKLDARLVLASIASPAPSFDGNVYVNAGATIGIEWSEPGNEVTIEAFKDGSTDPFDKVLVNHFEQVNQETGRIHPADQKTDANGGSYDWTVPIDFFPGGYTFAITTWDDDEILQTVYTSNEIIVSPADPNLQEPTNPPTNVIATSTALNTVNVSWIPEPGTRSRSYRSTSPWGPFRQQLTKGGETQYDDQPVLQFTTTPHLWADNIYCYAVRSSNDTGVSGTQAAREAGDEFYVWPGDTDNNGLSEVVCAQNSLAEEPSPNNQQPQIANVIVSGDTHASGGFVSDSNLQLELVGAAGSRFGYELYYGDQSGPIGKVHTGHYNPDWTVDHRPDGRDGRDGRIFRETHRDAIRTELPIYKDLLPGTYYVLVTAWNDADEYAGAFSNPFDVVLGSTASAPLSMPTGLAVELIEGVGIEATWDNSDRANDYLLFRSESPTGPFDTAVYRDSGERFLDNYEFTKNDASGEIEPFNLRYDRTYCYVVASANEGGQSTHSAPACQTTDPEPVELPELAEGQFDFPFSDNPDGEPYCENTQESGCWFDVQDFRTWRTDLGGLYHLGEDWNFGLGADDLYEPIYSIGDGVVEFVGDVVEGVVDAWEGIVVIRHDAPEGTMFLLPDETPETTDDNQRVPTIYSFYGHLDSENLLVSVGQEVARREQIGRIGNTPLTSSGPHLHWEIWVPGNPNIETDWRGPGYSSNSDGWIDPTDFVRLNRHEADEETTFQKRLGLDRWWATAGDGPIPISYTFKTTSAGRYAISFRTPSWQANAGAGAVIWFPDDSTIRTDLSCIDEGPITTCKVEHDLLEGTHSVTFNEVAPPGDPSVTSAFFSARLVNSLGPSPHRLNGFLIADHPELFQEGFQPLTITVDGVTHEKPIANAQELVETFSPILHFGEDERFNHPVSVTELRRLGIEKLGDTRCDVSGNSNCPAGDSSLYYDLQLFSGPYAPSPNPPTIYASLLTDTDHWSSATQIAITYHFAYPRSNWRDHEGWNTHEGDWESAILYLARNSQGNWVPSELAAAQHIAVPLLKLAADAADGGDRYQYQDLMRNGVRPNLFVGLGGHATYAVPGSTPWRGIDFDLTYIEEHFVSPNPLSNAQTIQLPRIGDLAQDSEFAWLAFAGHWGVQDLSNRFLVPEFLEGDDGP
ncbi:MAG: M23 family metallopeptidase, partial [Rubripirellula sp.]